MQSEYWSLGLKYNKEDHFTIEGTEERGGYQRQTGSFYCITNGKTYSSLGGLRNAIRPLKLTHKEYYDIFYKTEEESEPCCVCRKNERVFKNIVSGYSEVCSSTCFNKTEGKIEKVSNRFVGDPEKLKSSIQKRIVTISSRTSEEKDDIRRRTNSTVVERYGEEYRSNRAKQQWANKTQEEKTDISKKAVETRRKNGTLEYNFYASANKRVVIGGKEFFCQGYEDAVLKFLIQDLNINFDDIKNGKDVPRIFFEGNMSNVYRPDIYLPKMNIIIEVKSNFTMKTQFPINMGKQLATFNAGYFHVFIALHGIDKNRELRECDKMIFRKFLDMPISSQAQIIEKVQRLSRDWEYGAIAIGSGSAEVPVYSIGM